MIRDSGAIQPGRSAPSGPGYFLALVPGQHEVPRPARAYWMSDAAVEATAGRAGRERPVLDSVSADAATQPQEPSEGSRADRERSPDQRADAALVAALSAAPPDGLSPDELAARIGRSRTWVFTRLHVHEAAGRAVKLRRGRWTGGGER